MYDPTMLEISCVGPDFSLKSHDRRERNLQFGHPYAGSFVPIRIDRWHEDREGLANRGRFLRDNTIADEARSVIDTIGPVNPSRFVDSRNVRKTQVVGLNQFPVGDLGITARRRLRLSRRPRAHCLQQRSH